MKRTSFPRSRMAAVSAVAAIALMVPALADASRADDLDGDTYTCMGAERAGTESGVAEYTGKWVGAWPGGEEKQGYQPGPYADEEPLFTITHENYREYEERLTEGQKALLQRYPGEFFMKVYPSRRDFAFRDWVCDVVKHNARNASVVDDGLGITGKAGGIPFPFPEGGLQAIWNVINPHRPMSDRAIVDIANVYAGGRIAWGRQEFKTLNLGNSPDASDRGEYSDRINAYFYARFILPQRDRGFTAVGYQPNNFKDDATNSWQYQPGLRRVRQAPEVGFDYPVPPAGMRTVDDDYLFNGSPERYTWRLVGKREYYVPFHNFRVNDPAIPYSELIGENTINSKYVRYELRRVWVIEGELKSGVRHIYGRRVIYADEDTWLALWSDNYDNRDQLYRVNYVNFYYHPLAAAYHRGVSVYHDLTTNNYEAGYLVNERGNDWWTVNTRMDTREFSADAIARGGR